MKISLSWLKDFIDIDKSPEEIAALLTASGLEVEGIEKVEQVPGGLEGVVIGEVLTCEPHPNADRLSKTTVNIGKEVVPIVCGAPNVAAGQKVVVATLGATLYPSSGESFKIKKAKIRGEESIGMICAEDELGLGESHAGILVLDTDLPNGTPASNYFNLQDDVVLEIGLTPNRADAASHLGVARDLKALFNKPLSLPDVSAFAVENTDNTIEIEVKNLEACPRYTGITISNVKVTESPDWLKQRLQSIGIAPINNIVDVTNYVLHELGQPLHAFDAAKIKGNKVIVQTLAAGTKFKTLDSKERSLQAEDLMICNAEEGMCIAGVFGGEESGVNESTTSVFLESAYFSADWIRRTGQHHGLKTDASFRFERGTDPNIAVFALKRAALLIKKVAGGHISSEITDIYPKPAEDFRVEVSYKYIHTLIGKELPLETIHHILTNLDIKVEKKTEDGFVAVVPPYRVDVQRPADIVEEILRIYGYDNVEVEESLSTSYLAEFPATDENILKRQLSEMLAGNGFMEIMNNSLTKPHYTEEADFLDSVQNVEILNKLSEDLGVMRQSLLFGGLETIAYNISHRQTNLRLFEFGKTYHKTGQKYQEKRYLSLWLTGDIEPEHYLKPAKSVSYPDMAFFVDKILKRFGINQTLMHVIHEKGFVYGVEISYNGRSFDSARNNSHATTKQPLVRLGKVEPKLVKLASVKQEVFWAEIDWEQLIAIYSDRQITYQPISKYPEVKRDLSLVLDKSVTFEQVKNTTRKTEAELIKRINVFDVYEGNKIEKDKKAYALSFILQDPNKTLTDKVIDKTMQKLINTFESELGAIIRK